MAPPAAAGSTPNQGEGFVPLCKGRPKPAAFLSNSNALAPLNPHPCPRLDRQRLSLLPLALLPWVLTSVLQGPVAFAAPLAVPPPLPPSTPVPLARAHAHNDYEHARPLLDALDHGFCSVEADVWLIDGRLLVAHDREKVDPARTLEALYLQPLRERVTRNGGRVFAGGPTFSLLIDVKSDATNTWRALHETLRRHESMLTRFHPDRTETNAVTVVISGNRARDLMQAEPRRWAAYDGRLEDLDGTSSPHLIPWISDNWTKQFRWKAGPGEGPFPAAEREKLGIMVRRTHTQGRRLRFWALPDDPRAWAVLHEAGVDLLNTDDLPGLAAWLRAAPSRRQGIDIPAGGR